MHQCTPRYTLAERHALVDQQRLSGLSAAAFCREHDLVYQTFVGWRRRRADDGADRGAPAVPLPHPAQRVHDTLPEFIELGVSESADAQTPPGPVSPWLVELDLGGGMTLRVRQPG